MFGIIVLDGSDSLPLNDGDRLVKSEKDAVKFLSSYGSMNFIDFVDNTGYIDFLF